MTRRAMLLPRVLTLFLLLLHGGAGAGLAAPLPDVSGRVVGVHDGDTITVLTPEKLTLKVRLEGIDAPEIKQAFGSRAKEELSTLVYGKQVLIRGGGQDRYKRTLGRVFVGGQDVNLAMVRRGYAWRYVAYSKDRALIAAEREARASRRGLWTDPAASPPWEWRKADQPTVVDRQKKSTRIALGAVVLVSIALLFMRARLNMRRSRR